MSIKSIPYRIHDLYLSIRCWFRVSFNKPHLRMAKTAFESYPFDYGYLLNIERDKLKEMLVYFKHSDITTPETYAHMTRYISLAIKMIDIMKGDTNTFHYDGDFKFVEIEEKDENGEPLYELDDSEMTYHCDVNVNMKNLGRLVPNKTYHEFYHNHPHEFYELKARHLYYLIRYLHTEEWWD